MNRKILARDLSCLLLALGLAQPLAAQNRLYVQEADGKFHAVFKVSGVRPFIKESGKLVAAKGQRLALNRVEEYMPVFIAVRDKDARPTNASVDYANAPANNGVHFSAKFESADYLEDVFLVLEVQIANVGKKLLVYEVGQLTPQKPKSFVADLALGQYQGSGQIDLHLFVGGAEAFHSEQPEAYREEMLDRMIAKEVAAVKQAGPRPFYGATPAYPAALRNSGIKGEAVVTLHISPRGTVENLVVESATVPAFGEAALATVTHWRFFPQVRDGLAVESKVSIPFAFEPPEAKP